jgi:hypothetical protein
MTSLGSQIVMTLFRVIVCVPADQLTPCIKTEAGSLLLGTPGVSCVTCISALFPNALQPTHFQKTRLRSV